MGAGVPVLVALGVLPTIFIFWRIYSNAPVKKVPMSKLLKVFGLSMISVVPAAIIEVIGMAVLAATIGPNSHLYYLLLCIFVIALSEEGCKYLSFKLMVFNDRDFSNTYDGLFYGAAAALGFATLENIMYIFSNNGLSTAFLRMFLSVPGHAATGIFMGYYFGISKYKKYNNIHEDINPQRRAYLISVLLHGFFDFFLMDAVFCVTMGNNGAAMLDALGFIAIMITEYVIMIKTVRRGKRESFNIYNRFYYEKMNGAMQDMMGQTNEHLVQIPQYNYNSVPVGANNNLMGAPMPNGLPPMNSYGQPNMPPMNGAFGQPNMPPVNGSFGQPNMPPMNGAFGQPNMPPVNGSFGQPNMPPVNGSFGQPNMPPVNGSFGQPKVPPVNGSFGQPNVPPVNGSFGQPNVPPVNGSFGQPNVPPVNGSFGQPNVPPVNGSFGQPNVPPVNGSFGQPNIQQPNPGMQKPVMPAQPAAPVNAAQFGANDAQEEMQREKAFMDRLHKPVNRQIDVIFDEPASPVCPQCGTKCEKDSKFCIICGTKLA